NPCCVLSATALAAFNLPSAAATALVASSPAHELPGLDHERCRETVVRWRRSPSGSQCASVRGRHSPLQFAPSPDRLVPVLVPPRDILPRRRWPQQFPPDASRAASSRGSRVLPELAPVPAVADLQVPRCRTPPAVGLVLRG